MVKDVFGTLIEVGHVILISKGTRGHKDFETGIVKEIASSSKQIWMKTVCGYKPWNWQVTNPNAVPQPYESRHLVASGNNNGHVIVVLDLHKRNEIFEGLIWGADLLKASGEFPSNYILGEAITQLEVLEDEEIIEEIKEEPLSNYDVFSGMGMPESLSKVG